VDLSAEILDYIQNNFEQNVILVGHSMGGAIATHLAKEREVSGLLVIDVVEGTALEALEFMEGMATNRKKSFTDPSEVIDWYLKGGMVKNRESLRMTVGG
jgi:protein phosphatase methylesterase 1